MSDPATELERRRQTGTIKTSTSLFDSSHNKVNSDTTTETNNLVATNDARCHHHTTTETQHRGPVMEESHLSQLQHWHCHRQQQVARDMNRTLLRTHDESIADYETVTSHDSSHFLFSDDRHAPTPPPPPRFEAVLRPGIPLFGRDLKVVGSTPSSRIDFSGNDIWDIATEVMMEGNASSPSSLPPPDEELAKSNITILSGISDKTPPLAQCRNGDYGGNGGLNSVAESDRVNVSHGVTPRSSNGFVNDMRHRAAPLPQCRNYDGDDDCGLTSVEDWDRASACNGMTTPGPPLRFVSRDCRASTSRPPYLRNYRNAAVAFALLLVALLFPISFLLNAEKETIIVNDAPYNDGDENADNNRHNDGNDISPFQFQWSSPWCNVSASLQWSPRRFDTDDTVKRVSDWIRNGTWGVYKRGVGAFTAWERETVASDATVTTVLTNVRSMTMDATGHVSWWNDVVATNVTVANGTAGRLSSILLKMKNETVVSLKATAADVMGRVYEADPNVTFETVLTNVTRTASDVVGRASTFISELRNETDLRTTANDVMGRAFGFFSKMENATVLSDVKAAAAVFMGRVSEVDSNVTFGAVLTNVTRTAREAAGQASSFISLWQNETVAKDVTTVNGTTGRVSPILSKMQNEPASLLKTTTADLTCPAYDNDINVTFETVLTNVKKTARNAVGRASIISKWQNETVATNLTMANITSGLASFFANVPNETALLVNTAAAHVMERVNENGGVVRATARAARNVWARLLEGGGE